MDENPCRDVAKRKHRSNGFHSWTDDEIAQFFDYWQAGTMQRLAALLLLDTGQRSSDVCRMGPQHFKGGAIEVRQRKTNARLALYLQPETIAEIQRHDPALVFIRTSHGKAFTVKGFQKWFSNAATEAGLPHCSSHGLRKARARMIAEAGGTTEQIKSITGHRTDAEVNRYVRAASQKRLAKGVSDTIGKLNLSTRKNVDHKGKKR
jgi:integrase